jgi:electron transport complex protein RnfE
MNPDDTDIDRNERRHKNQGYLQLLALCPLLLISNSVVSALGLGLTALTVLTLSNLLLSLCRVQVLPALQLPTVILLVAALTRCAELLMQAWAFELHQALGMFVPLIVASCVLHSDAEGFASKRSPLAATITGLLDASHLLMALVAVGATRELLGTGALFADLHQLLPVATNWKLQVFSTDTPFLLAILTPGALLVTGLLLALKNVIVQKPASPAAIATDVVAGSKRVRVTGQI